MSKLTGGDFVLNDEKFIVAMENIISALRERGYDPYLQIYGYLQENDPAYITNHNGARDLIQTLDQEDVREFINNYLGSDYYSF